MIKKSRSKGELEQFDKELKKVHYSYYKKIISFWLYIILFVHKICIEYSYVLDRFDVRKLTFSVIEIQLRDMQLAVSR